MSATILGRDTAWTFDDRAPGLTLNRSELQRAVILFGSASRRGQHAEEDLHWNRIRDLLSPTVDIVPIESLAPGA